MTTIGTPAYKTPPYGDKLGYICAVTAEDTSNGFKRYTLGRGGMNPVSASLTIVWTDDTISEVPDNIAEPWLKRASERSDQPISNEQAAAMLQRAREAENVRHAEAKRERDKQNERRQAFVADAATRIPSWAKAVIVAEHEVDDCDIMTDYFNTKTDRVLILAWSKHTRDLFPELRQAARNAEETSALAEAPASAEHREKYSMGAGYYLKDATRYDTGWAVRKLKLYNGAESVPSGDWRIPETPAAGDTAPTSTSGARIEEHVHTKKGFTMFLVVLAERVDRDEYQSLLAMAKASGGWYSRAWQGTPGGFAFRDRQAAEAMLATISGDAIEPTIRDPAEDAADRWAETQTGL